MSGVFNVSYYFLREICFVFVAIFTGCFFSAKLDNIADGKVQVEICALLITLLQVTVYIWGIPYVVLLFVKLNSVFFGNKAA